MSARRPDYQPQLVEGLLPQIVAILQRDMLANLALANPAYDFQALGAAAFHTTPDDMYDAPPEIVVEPVRTTFVRDEQIALTAEHAFAVSAVVIGPGDTESLARLARDFARAMAMSLARAQDLSDYWAPLPITMPDGTSATTAGFAPGAVLEVSIASVDWALKAPQGSQFLRQPVVEIIITAVER